MVDKAVVLERALSFANEAIYTVALQRRRLGTEEPEDTVFAARWWVDLQFLLIALRRLRRAAQLATSVSSDLNSAIRSFDEALPQIHVMRNVGEHFDDYVLDDPKRHHKDVVRSQLQVGTWNGATWNWLGRELNVDDALSAAETLFLALRRAARTSD